MDSRLIADFIVALAALAAFTFGGRLKYKDAIIKDQGRIISVHREERELQDQKIKQLEKRIEFLEQMLGGDPHMVQERSLASSRRRRRGYGSANASGAEDGDL